jgi:hypothetical protein
MRPGAAAAHRPGIRIRRLVGNRNTARSNSVPTWCCARRQALATLGRLSRGPTSPALLDAIVRFYDVLSRGPPHQMYFAVTLWLLDFYQFKIDSAALFRAIAASQLLDLRRTIALITDIADLESRLENFICELRTICLLARSAIWSWL